MTKKERAALTTGSRGGRAWGMRGWSLRHPECFVDTALSVFVTTTTQQTASATQRPSRRFAVAFELVRDGGAGFSTAMSI